MVGDVDGADVEGDRREDLEDAENQEGSVLAELGDIDLWPLEEGAVLGENTCGGAEGAWDEGEGWH